MNGYSLLAVNINVNKCEYEYKCTNEKSFQVAIQIVQGVGPSKDLPAKKQTLTSSRHCKDRVFKASLASQSSGN